MSVTIFPKFSRSDSAADVRDAIGVYSTTEVDNLLAGLGALTAEDIDTLAEINAILTDANLASIAYVDGLASNYATAAQGALADSALQPSDITSGTITAGTGDIDFDNLDGGAESPLTLTAATAAEIPLTVQGAASQTAKLQEWKNSGGTVLASVGAAGNFVSDTYGDTGINPTFAALFRFEFEFGTTPFLMLHSSVGAMLHKNMHLGWSNGAHATTGGAGLRFTWVDDSTTRLRNASNTGGRMQLGNLNLENLPTSDPAVAGEVWNDGGTLKVSAG